MLWFGITIALLAEHIKIHCVLDGTVSNEIKALGIEQYWPIF